MVIEKHCKRYFCRYVLIPWHGQTKVLDCETDDVRTFEDEDNALVWVKVRQPDGTDEPSLERE